ncbi:hypothetical protein AVEN_174104-1 [Araneus ventricosus]|uniref:Uncharacterized protein n=1 Tax=Araneus ventricosus TaxID=182803 RepID=A0A4Y2C3J4_ARAVE|nr:hypothetical protein AVEN_174104-1 [Araneus ventricosus]
MKFGTFTLHHKCRSTLNFKSNRSKRSPKVETLPPNHNDFPTMEFRIILWDADANRLSSSSRRGESLIKMHPPKKPQRLEDSDILKMKPIEPDVQITNTDNLHVRTSNDDVHGDDDDRDGGRVRDDDHGARHDDGRDGGHDDGRGDGHDAHDDGDRDDHDDDGRDDHGDDVLLL